MNTFYMVFVEGCATPACKHESLDSAEKEAKRLATLLKMKAYVLCTIKSVEDTQYKIEDCRPSEVIYHFNRTDMSELTKIIFTINIVVLFIQLGLSIVYNWDEETEKNKRIEKNYSNRRCYHNGCNWDFRCSFSSKMDMGTIRFINSKRYRNE